MIGYKGKIAILSATTDAPDQNTWIAAMKDTLANDPKYKDMELVATVYGDDDPQKSTTEAEALLSTYPDLKGIISPTTVGVAAAAQVVQSAGKADTVHADRPRHARTRCAPSSRTARSRPSSSGAPTTKGWLAAHFAVGVKNGTIKNEVGETFEVPNLGTITIGEHNVMNTQAELTTFDADNIDDFNF